MDTDKKINRKATIQAILDKCNSGIGWSVKTEEFYEKIEKPGGDEFLIDAAGFCQVEVIYEK